MGRGGDAVLKTDRTHLTIQGGAGDSLPEEVLLATQPLVRVSHGWNTVLGAVGDAEERRRA